MHHVRRVIIDFPEHAISFILDDSEIMLPVRVVVRGEIIEDFHFLPDGGLHLQGKRGKALRLHYPSGNSHRLAAEIVEFSDAGGSNVTHTFSFPLSEATPCSLAYGARKSGEYQREGQENFAARGMAQCARGKFSIEALALHAYLAAISEAVGKGRLSWISGFSRVVIVSLVLMSPHHSLFHSASL